jgi:uncharacterized membrane protein
MSELVQTPQEPNVAAPGEQAVSATEQKARRILTVTLVVFGLLMVGMVVLLVFLSINAYQAALAGTGPDPGAVVVSLLRDAAIILVAFETLLIGVLMVVLALQVQALVVLLRDEIRPMLQALNETAATVRGTTQFVSHNIVSPSIQAASFLAGVRRVLKETVDLLRPGH